MDVVTLRITVASLGAVCCLCIVGMVACAIVGHESPPPLASVSGMCAGALVGILVPTRIYAATHQSNPYPVTQQEPARRE